MCVNVTLLYSVCVRKVFSDLGILIWTFLNKLKYPHALFIEFNSHVLIGDLQYGNTETGARHTRETVHGERVRTGGAMSGAMCVCKMCLI